METNHLKERALQLLQQLVSTPSFSREESGTAAVIEQFFTEQELLTRRKFNNLWICNQYYSVHKPTILLNSHHDTVKPAGGWSMDPFQPVIKDGKLFGLGSNDAGASLVSLMAAFLYHYDRKDMNYNLVFSATGEEESSGQNGIRSILGDIGKVDLAVVGEPTGMQLAIAEKGLLVLRCKANGISGHAARDIGRNAILTALKDIQWFSTFQFPVVSKLLGPVRMTVTMIEGGIQHNVIPDSCQFTVDIRTTDCHNSDEVLHVIKQNITSEITACSLNLKASFIAEDHEFVNCARQLGISTFGSPTLSDRTFIEAPSVKIGPGRSERSHTADEFIFLSELEQGIETYIRLFDKFVSA
jgi:acetylornithine deacetylase